MGRLTDADHQREREDSAVYPHTHRLEQEVREEKAVGLCDMPTSLHCPGM